MSNSYRVIFFAVVASTLFESCAIRPQVVRRILPILHSRFASNFVSLKKLTSETTKVLKSEDLFCEYRRQPAEVVAQLRRLHAENPTAAIRFALVEVCSNSGERLGMSNSAKAVGYHLAAAEEALSGALNHSDFATRERFRDAYNFSCGRVARLLFESDYTWKDTVDFKGPDRNYRLRCRTTGQNVIDPIRFDKLWVAANLQIKGLDTMKRHVLPGFGAAMIGYRNHREQRLALEPLLPCVGLSIPLGVTLDGFDTSESVEILFHDGNLMENVRLQGKTVPLHLDLSVSLATLFNFTSKGNVGWRGLRHPEQYSDSSGLFQLEPFREDKIPVIFVHGLMSSPRTWVKAVNELRFDPALRKRYQFLVFYYPTGFPIAYNSAALRQSLTKFQEFYAPNHSNPMLKKMVVIGHSMGGILSSAQIRGSGKTLKSKLFTKPLNEIQSLSAVQKGALKELFYYDANADITRTIFIAAPHRGSDFATNWVSSLGSKLIRFPIELLTMEPLNLREGLTETGQRFALNRPDGIKSLEPNGPVMTAILEQVISDHVTYHSIIGREDPREILEESSDALVPYWSSHLDGASSEKVVTAKHTMITENAETIEELKRILYLHAGLYYTAP